MMTDRPRRNDSRHLQGTRRVLSASLIVMVVFLTLTWAMTTPEDGVVDESEFSRDSGQTTRGQDVAPEIRRRTPIDEESRELETPSIALLEPKVLDERDPKGNRAVVRQAVLVERLRATQDDETRLNAAREVIALGLRGVMRGRALEALAQLEPSSVASSLRQIVQDEAKDPRARMNSRWIRNLGNRQGLMNSNDLEFFFMHGSDEVKRAAAAVLAERGDESLIRCLGVLDPR